MLIGERGSTAGLDGAAAEADALALLDAARLTDGEQLSLLFCDDATIHALNQAPQ